jgi:hypothetical protein
MNEYSGWTGAELGNAQSTADRFLSRNHLAICQCFSRQGVLLERLFDRLKRKDLTLEERLDCFARIAEVSSSMLDSANGFFDLGSQPVIARVLAQAELP